MFNKFLFRGKRCNTNEWIIGYYSYIGYTGKERHYITPSYASAFYGIEVHDYTVCRFTGLIDKNGMLIFEGDIIRHYNSIENPEQYVDGVIYFDYYNLDFRKRSIANDKVYKICDSCLYEVIGNKFDNPELLGRSAV